LLDPRDLVKISLIPASSITGLAAPPAITPVPSLAGFKMILLELYL
jgi:ribosomal protein S5